jgi:hypothetical protein
MLKRIVLLLLAPLVGSAVGFGLAFLLESGWLRQGWQPVAPSPEPAARLHALSGPNLWIEAASGQLYHNVAADTCATDCWTPVSEVTLPELDQDIRQVRPDTCVTPPPLWGAAETLAECQVGQWVDGNTAYARRRDGSLRVWRFTSGGEWVGLTYLLLIVLGAVTLFVLVLAAIAIVALVNWLRRRPRAASAKG